VTPRHEELIVGYIDGALSDAEREELLQALRSDPKLVNALADDLDIHRTLQFAASPGPDDERAADRILQFVRASLDGAGFLDRVKERALAESRVRTFRSLRLRRRSGPPSYAVPIGVAAALLVGLLFVAALPKNGKAPTMPRPAAPDRGVPDFAEAERDEAVLRERERRRAEERFAAEQKRLAEARQRAEQENREELRKKAEEEFARSQVDFKEAQERLSEARDRERRAKENLVRVQPAGTPDTPNRKTEATTLLASIERVEGQAFILSGTRRIQAKADHSIVAGEGLETGSIQSRAVVRYEDGTRLELGAAGTVRAFSDSGGLQDVGKRIELARGVLTAHVTPQPQGRALVIATPHGEARVLGTTLRIVIDGHSTRLEVTEGRVRLTRIPEGGAVEVTSGHFALAAAGVEPASWRIPPDLITVNFGAEGMTLPEGVWNDSGQEFDAKRGYGWKGPRGTKEIQGTFYIIYQATGRRSQFTPGVGRPMPAGASYDIDPATGKPKLFRPDRGAGVNPAQVAKVGPLKASGIALGWINHTETWSMPLPNGRYLVTACVGSADYEHGPHHVAIEGRQLINKVLTKAGQFFEVKDVPVDVKDGELTMVVGGYGTGAVSSDGSSDTILNYLILKKANGK